MSTAPGWYGKLPSLGDFASRRLAPEFIERWDLWLGEGLAAQRAALGEAWLEAYLNSPVWRFVLMPGVMPDAVPGAPANALSASAVAGVLMPSVDRVGRYFPLTIVAPLARPPDGAGGVEELLAWLHRLEDVALDALQDDWSIDQLDEVLAALPEPVIAKNGANPDGAALAAALVDGGFVEIMTVRSRAELAALAAGALGGGGGASAWPSPVHGRGFWLADNPAAPRLLVSRGLPTHQQTIEMLGASGRDDGATTIF